MPPDTRPQNDVTTISPAICDEHDLELRCRRCGASLVAVDAERGSLTLRQRREAAKVGIQEVANRSGVNPGRLSIIERGVVPTDDELTRIEDALAEAIAARPAVV